MGAAPFAPPVRCGLNQKERKERFLCFPIFCPVLDALGIDCVLSENVYLIGQKNFLKKSLNFSEKRPICMAERKKEFTRRPEREIIRFRPGFLLFRVNFFVVFPSFAALFVPFYFLKFLKWKKLAAFFVRVQIFFLVNFLPVPPWMNLVLVSIYLHRLLRFLTFFRAMYALRRP